MTRLITPLALAFALGTPFAQPALAAACIDGDGPGGGTVDLATTADVTFEGAASDACMVFGGNLDQVASPTSAWTGFDSAQFGSGAFSKITNFANPLFGDFRVTGVSADIGSGTGDWSISWTGGPATMDLVAGFKSGNEYGVFLFDEQSFAAAGTGDGTFAIRFQVAGPRNNPQDLSNFSLWWRDGTLREPPVTSVTLPGSLALLGIGMLAAGALRRRAAG